MYCKNCGNEIKEGTSYCTNCGANISSHNKKALNLKLVLGIIIALVIVATITIFVSMTKKTNTDDNNIQPIEYEFEEDTIDETIISDNVDENSEDVLLNQNPIVTIEMENGDIIKLELYPDVASLTVRNFISLINKGFYDGLTFHRVIPNMMAQAGDPKGNGTGGPGYSIFGEFSENGVDNDLKHEVGVISMARGAEPNSAGSQFFIVTGKNAYLDLDGKYAAFGRVIEGMDAVYDIVNSKVIRSSKDLDMSLYYDDYDEFTKQVFECDRPINPPVIKSIIVDTFGIKYDEPEKM